MIRRLGYRKESFCISYLFFTKHTIAHKVVGYLTSVVFLFIFSSVYKWLKPIDGILRHHDCAPGKSICSLCRSDPGESLPVPAPVLDYQG